MKKLTFALILSFSVLFSACNQEEKTINYSLNDISITAEAPLFEGSNTFQNEFDVKFKDFLLTQNLSEKEIKKIQVSSVNIKTVSPNNFKNYENILLQFYSETIDMKEIALYSKAADNNTSTISLETVKDNDVKDFLLAKKLGIVLDANLTREDSVNYIINLNINFSITI